MAEIGISSTKLAAILLVGILTSTVLSVTAIRWLDREAPANGSAEVQEPQDDITWNSGMEALDTYQCRKAETKQIILGGIEDNYTSDGEAAVAISAKHSFVAKRIGPKGALTVDRNYDESGFDRFFLDSVEVPTKATSGLFVLGARSLTKTSNDSLNVGDIESMWEATHNASYLFGRPEEFPAWTASRNVFAARLSDMTFGKGRFHDNGEPFKRDYENLLDFITSSPNEMRLVDVLLGDDHIVDFFGIAVCLPPEKEMGLTLRAVTHQIDPNYVNLGCKDANGENSCDPHAGDTLCSAALPLACFKPGDEPIKEPFARANMQSKWTGGQVKFTAPIVGASLTNGAQVHAVCRKEFGDGFRAATHQERANSIQFFAKGAPPPVKKAWIHAKTEPYGNCWAIDTEYKAAKP
ncbi:MAG: hypothetical protein ABJP70_06485 [Erythrobacter sp.]